ncbi:HAD family hydrolase [Legionella sp. km772]|uniref:HAD family hydrolase n=1 Tax=Legionella sp. km772 TaxID=2498111 RepID=UPI000F8D5C66|nr:HAD family hydrolase [Legionella sp. km772]RUR08351.1 cation-transporting P-type ATPase [Legionella sp. km772]
MLTKKDKSQIIDLRNIRALPLHLIQNAEPDRTYFISNALSGISHFFSARVNDLYNSLVLTFSLESMDWSSFTNYIWPSISSGAALLLGNYLTEGLSEYATGSPEYDFVFKFIFGAAVLGYCALNRITDQRFSSKAALSAAVASEVMAITYMYSSVFNGTHYLLGKPSSEYSLIAGLGVSAIAVPSGISYLTQKVQDFLVRLHYNKGAQRSDTAIISSGLTSVSNLYFQINHFIASELMVSSRAFQLGLISHNIRYADRIVQRFRNLPALLADLTPSTIKKMRLQQEKLDYDYDYNHKIHQVLRVTDVGCYFLGVPRYQLRTGDLVYCDESIDLDAVPVSGELIALRRDSKDHFTQNVEQQKFSVNLKAQNGEDVWIEQLTKADFTSNYKKIDLYAVRDGKQAGVLVGDKLNLYGKNNVFIQIKPEKELLLTSDYEKRAVIDDIIASRKKKSVLHSILGSIIMAAFLKRDITAMPAETLKLMFTLFQTMIPFSEAFLRETINSRLVKKLNNSLGEHPLETIDALRVVDLCNALGGYYRDRFAKGVAIISDKTGTLTTTRMDVLGLWTTDMDAEVQASLSGKDDLLLPSEAQWLDSFEVFCSAFTNNKKELEPEEHAILEFFKRLLANKDCLKVATHGNNHFKKEIISQDITKEIETFHLGLYRNFGGRFTLTKEGTDFSLVFCGVPKEDAFKGSSVFKAYAKMQSRTGVLSRDWCLAKAKLTEEEFRDVHQFFEQDNKVEIEQFIVTKLSSKEGNNLGQRFNYYGTFLIDNPVKKDAEKFIAQCRELSVPVFVATGDTTKAAKNIATVLCPSHAQHLRVINAKEIKEELPILSEEEYPANSTVVFSGVNDQVLELFQQLMARAPDERPVIIFAEMSTEGKGVLARYLKDHHYFVVANGDGTNDVMMMKSAHMVIAHHSDDGTFAPGVGLARSGDLEQNSGKIRAIPGLLVHSPYSQNGLSTSP